jgi:hypothetical protein
MKCYENRLAELKMIYRGSEHEFTRKSWGDLCLGKGPTLTVIQAESGRVFGGYTSQNWAKSGGYKKDDKAWIFSFYHLS